MADTPAKPKPKNTEPSKWARERPKPDSGVKKRRQLWEALHEFTNQHGGWIVSPPDADLRIEIPERSELPSKLIELGYRPLTVGQATRLMNKPGAPTPWVPIDILVVKLSGQ